MKNKLGKYPHELADSKLALYFNESEGKLNKIHV